MLGDGERADEFPTRSLPLSDDRVLVAEVDCESGSTTPEDESTWERHPDTQKSEQRRVVITTANRCMVRQASVVDGLSVGQCEFGPVAIVLMAIPQAAKLPVVDAIERARNSGALPRDRRVLDATAHVWDQLSKHCTTNRVLHA